VKQRSVVYLLFSIKQNCVHLLIPMKQNPVVHWLFFFMKQNQGPSIILFKIKPVITFHDI